mgnify:CR=1 FL=1
MDIENIDLFPFVLSLSKHERGFAGQAPNYLRDGVSVHPQPSI